MPGVIIGDARVKEDLPCGSLWLFVIGFIDEEQMTATQQVGEALLCTYLDTARPEQLRQISACPAIVFPEHAERGTLWKQAGDHRLSLLLPGPLYEVRVGSRLHLSLLREKQAAALPVWMLVVVCHHLAALAVIDNGTVPRVLPRPVSGIPERVRHTRPGMLVNQVRVRLTIGGITPHGEGPLTVVEKPFLIALSTCIDGNLQGFFTFSYKESQAELFRLALLF